MNEFNFYDTQMKVRCSNESDRRGKPYVHYGTFHRLMNFLADLGFKVSKDPEIEERYKRLSNDYRYGILGELEFKAHRYPNGFEIVFYQNINFENPNGGYYDFNKFEKMPYLMQKRFQMLRTKITQFLTDLDYVDRTKSETRFAVDFIKADYVHSCHKPQTSMDFDLSEIDGIGVKSIDGKDRDGKQILNGQIKYFRNTDGYLMRGKVYHNTSNMWWVILNKTELSNVASFELFDLTPADKIGRDKKRKIPTEKRAFLNQLTEYTTKELIRELKRRNITIR